MRTPTATDLDRLTNAAASWLGTPFCANSATKGAGVSCHQYVAAVYEEAGWTEKLSIPDGPPTWSRAQARSLMEDWLDGAGSSWFESVDVDAIQPGDLLGFRIGTCVHHLGILLEKQYLAHCDSPKGPSIAPVSALPSAWAKRLVRAWRPRLP